jgi:hypothetical protein
LFCYWQHVKRQLRLPPLRKIHRHSLLLNPPQHQPNPPQRQPNPNRQKRLLSRLLRQQPLFQM